MNLAAALLGETPKTLSAQAMRAINGHGKHDEPTRETNRLCYQTRQSNCNKRYRTLLQAEWRNKAFTANTVRLAELQAGRGAGIRPITRVIAQMLAEGLLYELRRIPIHDGRIVVYYAFRDSSLTHEQLLAMADKNFAIQAKSRRKAAAAMLRNWDRAITGFTHYQAKLYLQSDRYAAHAINDMLAAGELTKTTQSYSRSRQRYIYQLKDAA